MSIGGSAPARTIFFPPGKLEKRPAESGNRKNSPNIIAPGAAHETAGAHGPSRGYGLRIDLFALGGEASLIAIGWFRFDFAVIGYSGFDEDGAMMDFDLEKVAVNRQAMARTASMLATGDSSKFMRRALVHIAPPDSSTMTATDTLSEATRKRFVETFGYKV